MIDIIVIRGAGNKQGPEIKEELITTESMARIRGKAYIDGEWYKRRKKEIQVPFRHGLYVGCVACVEESTLGITGNHQVTAFTITIDNNRAINYDVSIEQHVGNT